MSKREEIIAELTLARQHHCFPFDLSAEAQRFGMSVLGLLFPHFAQAPECSAEGVRKDLALVEALLEKLLLSSRSSTPVEHPDALADRFISTLPRLRATLLQDADAIFHGDPAARSQEEVILAYPGFFAIAIYRVAHELHLEQVPLLPRLLAEFAHQRTGVDIHPGATIGPRFFIDHGTGVVIGETSVIGTGVKLYQGVTLGALVVEKDSTAKKRHPTLEDHVIVYSNATILGGETVIGHDTIVGGNAWLTRSVPPFSVVTHESEVRPRKRGGPKDDQDYQI